MPSSRRGSRKQSAALVAAAAFVLATAGMARAGDTAVGPGTSATGCPAFWDMQTASRGPNVDPPVGPYGTSQLHITGYGVEVQGDALTVTIRVADMQRRVQPGTDASVWWAQMDNLRIGAQYILASDRFTFTAFNGIHGPVTGTVIPGPGGGIRITTSLSALEMEPGVVIGSTQVGGRSWKQVGDPQVSFPWSAGYTPPEIPLVPCPGLTMSADLARPGERVVAVNGVTLPKSAGQPVELQLLDGADWRTVGSGTTAAGGTFAFEAVLPGPGGKVSLRGAVKTPAGVGTSAPIELSLP